MVKKSRALFFDRDGVLIRGIKKNNKLYAVNKLKELRFLPGAIKFLKKYIQKYKIIVITNQPDVSNKKLSMDTLISMNKKMLGTKLIDDIFFCIHFPSDNCNCRKPKIGLIKIAEKKYNIDLKKSYFFGDRKSDIDAGKRSGMKTIFIDRKYSEPKPTNQNYTVNSIKNALKINFL